MFLEVAVLSVIGRAFEVERGTHEAPDSILLDEGLGVLITEPGLFDVPELLVVFAYDQPWDRDAVFLHYAGRTEPEELEDPT